MYSFQCLHFDKLSTRQLYRISALRQEVFVVEQNCPYLDADGKDEHAYHFMLWKNDDLAGYFRLLPKGISYTDYASIGRVVTAPLYRSQNLGRELMRQALIWCSILFPGEKIKISAQSHLENFYGSFGFEPTGEYYLEDDIPHSAMIFMPG